MIEHMEGRGPWFDLVEIVYYIIIKSNIKFYYQIIVGIALQKTFCMCSKSNIKFKILKQKNIFIYVVN